MRRRVLLVFVGSAAIACATSAVGQGFQPPLRRAGWWETSMTMQLGGRPQTIISRMCTNDAIERKYSVLGAAAAGQNCSKREMHPIPGGFAFSSSCSARSGGVDVSNGTATGDFKTQYHLAMTTQPSGRPERHTTMDAKWMGACPAGRKPGDSVMPNGMVINIDSGMTTPTAH